MNYIIREINKNEIDVLDDFLYEAIFIPEGVLPPEKDIIKQPETPSFAISLYKEYRGYGIGTDLMKKMLALLKQNGYKQASLAVQKANYAVKMYKNVGFYTIGENEEEYIMLCEF